jgi:hypothetical protein
MTLRRDLGIVMYVGVPICPLRGHIIRRLLRARTAFRLSRVSHMGQKAGIFVLSGAFTFLASFALLLK